MNVELRESECAVIAYLLRLEKCAIERRLWCVRGRVASLARLDVVKSALEKVTDAWGLLEHARQQQECSANYDAGEVSE